MKPLAQILATGRPRRVLCLGAHADDIEIGCAGTLLRWQRESALQVTWVVMGATGARAAEARRSARALLGRGATLNVVIGDLPDTRFATEGARAKAMLAEVAAGFEPDLVLTHRLEDRHQDHRAVAEWTWQTWRDHCVLEYEIPKYEGDLGQPNVYVPLPARLAERKLRHLSRHFATQAGKAWFREPTFRGLMALRAVECRAPEGHAEAFHLRKGVV